MEDCKADLIQENVIMVFKKYIIFIYSPKNCIDLYNVVYLLVPLSNTS